VTRLKTIKMAKDKKTVLVYCDWIKIFEKLTYEEAGKLIKLFFEYVNDLGEHPADRVTELLFESIKQQLKRDLKKYEAVCERNRKNGLNGGRPKNEKKEETETNPEKPTGLKTNPKKAHTDTDTDTDKEKDSNNTFQEKPEKVVKTDFIDQVIICFSEQFLKYRGVKYFISNKKIERSMAGKLLKAYKQNTKNVGKTSEQTLMELSEFFEKCMLITDKYINETMSFSTIINQFNKIINILRNGNKQSGVKQGVTDAELATIIANGFGSDSPNGK
jgi:hypothetical protein